EPFHFGAIGRGFLRDENVTISGNSAEAVDHAARAAEDFVTERRISFTKPRSEANAAGNVVEFGNDVTRPPVRPGLGQDQIGTDDAWKVVAEFLAARKFDKFGWFSTTET